MSHYSNCCCTPVPLPHSLFQFLLGLLAAPSPLSPSTLPFCPALNNSLTSHQPTLLTPFHSFFLPKSICKPLCIVGESNTLGPFPKMFSQTASAPITGMCLAKIPNLSLSPCCTGITWVWEAVPYLLGDGEKLSLLLIQRWEQFWGAAHSSSFPINSSRNLVLFIP